MRLLSYAISGLRLYENHECRVNDRNDEHCGLSLSGSASERL